MYHALCVSILSSIPWFFFVARSTTPGVATTWLESADLA